ncbi:MAG: hypothetical protein HXY21_13815 [Parvularculaceae bacterium]|nr:hypothetical protein [Parvularculaceae bacterium]
MRVQISAAAAFALAFSAAPAGADDFTGDIPALREFLDADKSYSVEERARAEAAFEALKARAGDIPLAEFHLAVARIAAISMNGHTMSPPGVWPHRFNRIPLELHAFADGVRVIHAPDEMRELLGARVVSIAGRDVAELATAFGDYFGARVGKRDEWAPFFLESPALLNAAGLTDAADGIEAVFELPGGEIATRLLDARLDPPAGGIYDFFDHSRLVARAAENAGGAAPLYLLNDGKAFRSAPLPELDGWYIQLRINKSFYEQKIDAFIKRSLKDIARAKPKTLVVDLRLDGGGDLNTTRAFMQKLPDLAPGRIFILTSGRTFSAGIASAGYLKQAAPDRVIIVGEPIGDFLEFYAEGGLAELPLSKASLLAATERHNYMTGCPEPDCHRSIREAPIRVGTLEPDIAAPLTYADYRMGVDPALEAVKRRLAER